MSQINSVTMYWTENYVSYNDCDSMTDYFHGFRATTKYTIEKLKEDGADVVNLRPINCELTPQFISRAKKIAKGAGYTADFKIEECRGVNRTWKDPFWTLKRIK